MTPRPPPGAGERQRKPVIIEAIWGLDVGGAEVLLLERLRASDRTRMDYFVVVSRPELRALAGEIEALGIPVLYPGAGPRRLLARIKALRPTVINVHSPLPGLWLKVAAAAGYFPTPAPRLIETVHSGSYGRPVFERVSATLNPVLDHLVAVSDAVAASPLTRFGPPPLVVRPGVDVDTITAWSRDQAEVWSHRPEVTDRRVVLAMVAGFRAVKNHLRLVEAVDVVARTDPGGAEFVVLLAGDGPTRPTIERAIAARHLQGYFRYLGNVRHGWQVIASADAAVLTSDREGLPVVVMEAIAAGRPVLSSNVGGVPELVTDGVNGLLFNPDPLSAARAIRAFVTDADLRGRLQRQAAQGRSDVDIAHTARQMEHLYDGVVRRR